MDPFGDEDQDESPEEFWVAVALADVEQFLEDHQGEKILISCFAISFRMKRIQLWTDNDVYEYLGPITRAETIAIEKLLIGLEKESA